MSVFPLWRKLLALGTQALQKLALGDRNSITSTGVGVLLDTMAQSCHITNLDLNSNPIGNEGASLVARALENNVLPNLTRLSPASCVIENDEFIELISALEQNTSLLYLDLRRNHRVFTRAFLALAECLPKIKM
jgi:Ran GTPase-activating protein (RanGAP) involved in mRNA processing and transport